MKLTAVLLSNLLFASSILAAPSGSRLADRVARRAARNRSTHPLIPASGPKTDGGNNASQISYSSNWAGAVYTSPPSGQTFNGVSGSFNVPSPKAGSGSESSWSSSAWVGIDGDTYGDAILQSGVDFTVDSSGDVSYDAWYEWYPDGAYDFDGISFSAGDEVSVTITASSSSAGKVVLENTSTGTTVTKSLTAPSSSNDLGGQNAEWIVEDYDENGSAVPLANFGTVTFTDCKATTSEQTLDASGAGIIEMEDSNGNVITDVSIPSDSEVKVTYV
ncbi:MAG: hypothetical protein M1819_000598 [Sarea resinae]|nr:MAG: hypothetical protein M1819_000598 [Sarea resinae]